MENCGGGEAAMRNEMVDALPSLPRRENAANQPRGFSRRLNLPCYACLAISISLLTVFQFLAVTGTPRACSTLAANLERPIPSGAYR